MQRSHGLLRRAWAGLAAQGTLALPADLAARGVSAADALLGWTSHVQPLLAGRTFPAPSTPYGLPLSAGAVRLLHGSAAPHSDDPGERQAALRRLAVARMRREKQAPVPASRPAPPGHAGEQPQEQQLQQPPDGALVAAGAMAVVPQEGKASEAQIATALDHPALIVTRPIEWGTVIFGYEQANRYTVYDDSGRVVALVAEDTGGLGKEVGRQLLRTRRSFTATVFSADGSQVLFRLRRPVYVVSSTMYVEDGTGEVLGEIHQRWHALKRNYDLYMGKSQFAAISGTFLAWEFELKDAAGGTLALVDRNFQGFGKEIFTDAGKYVVHFGYQGQQLQQVVEAQAQAQAQAQQQQLAPGGSPHQPSQQLEGQQLQAAPQSPPAASVTAAIPAPAPAAAPPPVTPIAVARTDVTVIPTASGNQLVVARPLGLSERMVALACAITIDYDYFSQHSRSGGGLVPPLIVPMPGGGTAPAPEGAGGAGPAAGGGDVPAAGAAGAAQGAVGEVPLGSGGGFGAAGEAGPAQDGGLQDGFDPGRSWGEQGGGDGEMKWDLGGDAGSGAGGAAEEGGGVIGVLKGLWELFGSGE